MSEIRHLVKRYISVPRSIKLLLVGAFLLQLLNASSHLILNIFLRKLGYLDTEIANFISYRFISILLFSIPFGLIIKGKKLKPFFMAGAIIVPLSGIAILFAANAHISWLIKLFFIIASLGFMLEHVTALPFILRHGDNDTLSESIALNFAVWSLASIVSGLLIKVAFSIAPKFGLSGIGEFEILLGFSILSALSILPFLAIKENFSNIINYNSSSYF